MDLTSYKSIIEPSMLYISTGIIFVGIVLYLYLFIKFVKNFNMGALFILALAYIFNLFNAISTSFVTYNNIKMALVSYFISQLVMTFLMPAILYYVRETVTIDNEKVNDFNRIFLRFLIVLSIGIIIVAMIKPELFISLTVSMTHNVQSIYAVGRGTPGIIYKIRGMFLSFILIYSIILLVYYVHKNKLMKTHWIILFGFICVSLSGMDDIMRNITGRAFFLNGLTISRFPIGTVIFCLCILSNAISIFVNEIKETYMTRKRLILLKNPNETVMQNITYTAEEFVEYEDKLANIASSLRGSASNLASICNMVSLYSESLVDTSKEFEYLDEEQREIFNSNKKMINELFSSFTMLKFAISKQHSAIEVSLEHVANGMENLKKTQNTIKKLAGVSGELVYSSTDIREKLVASFEKLESIGQISNQIKKSISFIKDISDKTNLLAINANIQSSKSGGHGPSFALVAKEIADLAIESRQGTEKIEQLFNSIANTLKDFVTIKNYVTKGFDSIINHIDTTAIKIDSIATTVSKQIEGSGHILDVIKGTQSANEYISDKINTQSKQIENINFKFEDLEKQFRELHQKSLDQIREIDELSTEIYSTIDLSKKINETSLNIVDETESIKGDFYNITT